VFLFGAAPAGNVTKSNLILKIDEVWEQKYKAFQILAAQHLWGYYEQVAPSTPGHPGQP
jgi:hypothetical protein